LSAPLPAALTHPPVDSSLCFPCSPSFLSAPHPAALTHPSCRLLTLLSLFLILSVISSCRTYSSFLQTPHCAISLFLVLSVISSCRTYSSFPDFPAVYHSFFTSSTDLSASHPVFLLFIIYPAFKIQTIPFTSSS
jgi:hypothetical protein